jgi:uncharacterized protein YukE
MQQQQQQTQPDAEAIAGALDTCACQTHHPAVEVCGLPPCTALSGCCRGLTSPPMALRTSVVCRITAGHSRMAPGSQLSHHRLSAVRPVGLQLPKTQQGTREAAGLPQGARTTCRWGPSRATCVWVGGGACVNGLYNEPAGSTCSESKEKGGGHIDEGGGGRAVVAVIRRPSTWKGRSAQGCQENMQVWASCGGDCRGGCKASDPSLGQGRGWSKVPQGRGGGGSEGCQVPTAGLPRVMCLLCFTVLGFVHRGALSC